MQLPLRVNNTMKTPVGMTKIDECAEPLFCSEKGEFKMKQKYISPECEITKFKSEDILVASGITQDAFAEFDEDNFVG